MVCETYYMASSYMPSAVVFFKMRSSALPGFSNSSCGSPLLYALVKCGSPLLYALLKQSCFLSEIIGCDKLRQNFMFYVRFIFFWVS